MNMCTFSGNLARDPETRTTARGTEMTSFTIGITQRSSNGEKDTLWLRVTCFGKQSDTAKQYLHRGTKVLVWGPLKVSSYEGRDGSTKVSADLTCNGFEFLDSHNATREGYSGNHGGQQGNSGNGNMDEMPF